MATASTADARLHCIQELRLMIGRGRLRSRNLMLLESRLERGRAHLRQANEVYVVDRRRRLIDGNGHLGREATRSHEQLLLHLC